MADDHFLNPKRHIDWGRKAIDDLKVACDGFFTNDSFPLVKEFNLETGETIHKLAQIADIPDDFGRLTTECLNNIKNSFDQSLFAACLSTGYGGVRDIHFPWSESVKDLEGKLRHRREPFPDAIRDVIFAEEPYPRGNDYPGGDDIIRGLAKISNGKHTVGIFIRGRAPTIQPRVAGDVRGKLIIPIPFWDEVNKEIALLRITGEANIEYNITVTFNIFIDAPAPVGVIDARDALTLFTNKADRVLKSFKRACGA